MSGLIGKKIGMTSIYDENGKNIPCTVIEAGPCVVTQVRTKEVDGYEALQLGFDDKAEKQSTKALNGHFKKAGTTAKKRVVEFQGSERTHGQQSMNRAPGSVGAASYPARIFKGMRMGGRMGGETITVQNLRVLKVVKEKNLLVIKGAIPGHNNSYVIIKK